MVPTIFLGVALLVTEGTTLEEKEGEKKAGGDGSVESVLGWLPEDTESIIVAPSFEVKLAMDEGRGEPKLQDFLQDFTVSAFSFPGKQGPAQTGPLEDALKGSRLKLGLKAARRFTFPGGLGIPKYEGCDVAIFERPEEAKKVWEAVKKLGKKKLEGLKAETFVFEEKLELATWTFYISQPRENVLLCATQDMYLKEVLARMAGTEKGCVLDGLKKREEWKLVRRENAPVWCIRVFRRETAATDPGSPMNPKNVLSPQLDDQARGIGYSLAKDGKKIEARYFTGAKEALQVARGLWLPPGAPGKAELDSAGIVRLTFDAGETDAEGILPLLILAMTGYVVFI